MKTSAALLSLTLAWLVAACGDASPDGLYRSASEGDPSTESGADPGADSDGVSASVGGSKPPADNTGDEPADEPEPSGACSDSDSDGKGKDDKSPGGC